MSKIYEVGILVSSIITTAVVTYTVTKKEDEKKFIQFKQNMEELKKENLKLKKTCSDNDEEIEDLEKEITILNQKYSKSLEEKQDIIDFMDKYQTSTSEIFTNMSKSIGSNINIEYLNAAEQCICSDSNKTLTKSMKRMHSIEPIVEEYDNLLNVIDDEDDEDDEIEFINQMSLDSIITPSKYQEICNRIENIDDEETAFSYKYILDNILEYIYTKRSIVNKSTHKNEINDLNFISQLNVDNDTLEKIEEFYDTMKFCIININDVYKYLQKYYLYKDNQFLNKLNFFNNNSIIKEIPIILFKTDNVNNDDRIKIIMTLSSILRKIKMIIDCCDDKQENIDKFYSLIDDISLLNQGNLSDASIDTYITSEYDAMDEYEEMIEEYLANNESSIN